MTLRLKPGAQPAITDFGFGSPKVRRQLALDPQVIQLKFDDGRIPGKEPQNVPYSDVKRSNPSIVSFSPDNHLRGLVTSNRHSGMPNQAGLMASDFAPAPRLPMTDGSHSRRLGGAPEGSAPPAISDICRPSLAVEELLNCLVQMIAQSANCRVKHVLLKEMFRKLSDDVNHAVLDIEVLYLIKATAIPKSHHLTQFGTALTVTAWLKFRYGNTSGPHASLRNRLSVLRRL